MVHGVSKMIPSTADYYSYRYSIEWLSLIHISIIVKPCAMEYLKWLLSRLLYLQREAIMLWMWVPINHHAALPLLWRGACCCHRCCPQLRHPLFFWSRRKLGGVRGGWKQLWGRMQPTTTWVEGNKVDEKQLMKINNQPLMEWCDNGRWYSRQRMTREGGGQWSGWGTTDDNRSTVNHWWKWQMQAI